MIKFRLPVLLFALTVACTTPCRAHSGKARFHVVVDTDGAADDLRALCLFLGNREVEVLAVTVSEGALQPHLAATQVASLLEALHHEGIPVGEGRAVGIPAPTWRQRSQQLKWGDTPGKGEASDSCTFPTATEVLSPTLRHEEEPITFVALGAITNLADLLRSDSTAARRISRIIRYGGANDAADSTVLRQIEASGIPVITLTENPAHPIPVTRAWLDTLDTLASPHAQRIVATHRAEPLSELIATGHLRVWDELIVAFLFAPELFQTVSATGNSRHVIPCATSGEPIKALLCKVLRGNPASESRVFQGFPMLATCYAPDVQDIVKEAATRYGTSEWRAGVLTNELHGHLGIYAILGVKMGIRVREYFDIGIDDMQVTSLAGQQPPISCLNDGLQVSTGATLGHGLIRAEATDAPRPEAQFSFKGRTVWLALKPEYARRIRQDIGRGIALHGNRTEAYWQYVRSLALQYWLEFDRHALFDIRRAE